MTDTQTHTPTHVIRPLQYGIGIVGIAISRVYWFIGSLAGRVVRSFVNTQLTAALAGRRAARDQHHSGVAGACQTVAP